ncbi:alcohol oxidase [Wilcoxina mikolae CBS 423.85]|nr:alcohol oxidase [Wilcoxina mikolae CBS 423.85]
MHSRFLFAIIASFQLASAFPFPGVLVERQEDLKHSYDYVVVGGGTEGLAVANRLSENKHKSVLVVEAGVLFNETQDDIMIPGYSAALGFKYQWNFMSQPIKTLKDSGTFMIPAAKAVGGESAINSMSFDRGSKADYDMWEAMGNKGWGWDGMLPYFKKSETFHPPSEKQVEEFGIGNDPEVHGTDGPIQVKFSSFIYPQYKTIVDAWKKVGVPVPKDATNGEGVGSLWIASPIDPKTETRSYARTGYHDKAANRSNYHLIVGQQVTKILFDKSKQATGVIFSKDASSPSTKISVKEEVILAAGAFNNPKLLQLSGIGPKSLLEKLEIPVLVDLPGVGSNLQDHALVRPLNYTTELHPTGPYIDPTPALTNTTYQAEQLAEYKSKHTGYYTRPLAGSTVAYIPLPIMAPDMYKSIIRASRSSKSEDYLPYSAPAVMAGLKKQKKIILDGLMTEEVGAGEVSLRPGIAPGPALVTRKPLSRGYIEIASTNAFEDPKIYYNTLSDPTDVSILTQNIKFSRAFFESIGMASFKPVETYPGKDVTSDEALAEVAKGRIVNPSVGHASCTCPMMDREIGGVVDEELKVYGVKGLRVVDLSIMPIIPCSHLVNTRYAIAEKAADIIKSSK